MTKKRFMVGLLCAGVIFSLAGCWLDENRVNRVVATKYLKSHTDMTEREIRKFIHKDDIGQERLLELAKSKSWNVRIFAAINENLPNEYLERMLDDKSWKVVRACSWNPNFTTDMFEKLTHHKDKRVRSSLATHDRLPLENLITLSKDEAPWVRRQASKDPRLPETEMRRLFLEGNHLVKRGLAENYKIPMDILMILSEDHDHKVREKVASNPSLPEIDMRRLFSEKGRAIMNLATRRGLVKNPNTPIDILIELSKDNKKYISSDALRHPRMKQYQKTEQGK